MITDALKKEALESLLAELETREVDQMAKEPGEPVDDACPYCDESCAEDNPECSMHGIHMKKGEAPKPKSVLKIKIGGKAPQKEEAY